MPEAPGSNPNPNNDPNPKGADPQGDQNPPEKKPEQGADQFDPSKLGDDAFEKVFEDPRLFKHSRFKELTEAKKERDKMLQEQKEREAKELEEKGEFQKLAEQRANEISEWKSKYERSLINNALIQEAVKAGAIDTDAVIKLADTSKLQIGEDGLVEGISDVISALKAEKEYLFNKQNQTVGNPSAPSAANSQTVFTRSQITDPKFYRENKEAITQATIEGRVDMSK